MAWRSVLCTCGHRMVVDDSEMGRTGKCVRCRELVTVTKANSYLSDEKIASAPRMPLVDDTAAASEGGEAEAVLVPTWRPLHTACARCGRAFRGDWDRVKRPDGIVCNICANMTPTLEEILDAKEKVAGKRADEPVQTAEEAPPMPFEVLNPPPAPHAAYLSRRKPFAKTMREVLGVIPGAVADFASNPAGRAVIFVGGAFFIISVAMALPLDEWIAGAHAADEKPAAPDTPAVLLLHYGLMYISLFLLLYLGLAWTQKLPNDQLLHNMIALGAVAFGLFLIRLGGSFTPLSPASVIVCYVVAAYLYDLDAHEIVSFILVGVFLLPIAWVVEMVVKGMLLAQMS